MSRRRFRSLVLALGLLAGAARAADVTDDLQCFKVTNETLKKLKAVVDLDTPSVGAASGCKLSKAKLYCVPTKTSLRPGTVVDGHTPVEAIPFGGPPAESARICYGLKCKKPGGTAGDQMVLDQLGEHRFKKLTTSMVCRSVVGADVFCGDGPAGSCEPGFRIVTPNVDVQSGQEITYCYYFHTPNTDPLAIKQFTSHMPASIKRLSVVLTNTDLKPPGTLSASDCSPGSAGGIYYAGYGTDDEFTFPPDDGTGTPVGVILPPGQSGYIWMHSLNDTTDVVNVHAEVGVFGYPSGATVTRADPYVTFNGDLAIGPMAMNKSFSFSCDVPAGAKFFSLSSQSNKQSVHVEIDDTMAISPQVFGSDDFQNPGRARFSAPNFFSFTSGKLLYSCTYSNLGDNAARTIHSGDSVATDEVCMALGFFFPSTGPVFCYNDIISP